MLGNFLYQDLINRSCRLFDFIILDFQGELCNTKSIAVVILNAIAWNKPIWLTGGAFKFLLENEHKYLAAYLIHRYPNYVCYPTLDTILKILFFTRKVNCTLKFC